MQAADIVGWRLTRRAKAQPVTTVQKFGMVVVGIVVVGSFVMLCLQAVGWVPPDFPYFSHILASSVSAIVAYLFGRATG